MIYALCSLATSTVPAMADTIVLKDASRMEVYNVEEAGKWILYTEQNDADAPLQRIAADKVFAIKVGEGDLKMVGGQSPDDNAAKTTDSEITTDGPVKVDAKVSADNAARIAQYNAPELRMTKPKDDKFYEKHDDDYCAEFLTVWGITESSVISDENIAVDFELTMPQGKMVRRYPQTKVKITNKTNKPICIDLANSFKFAGDGTAKPYFNNSVYTESNTSGHGASMNLGAAAGALGIGDAVGTLASGIGIGGGSSKTATVTTAQERILMTPPYGAVYLPPMKYASGNDLREDYETLYFRNYPLGGPMTRDGDMRRYDGNKGYVHTIDEDGLDNGQYNKDNIKAPIGRMREISENDSPKKLRRIITYSTSSTFATYSSIDFTLYIRGVFGGNLRWNAPADYSTNLLVSDDDTHLLIGAGHVKKK